MDWQFVFSSLDHLLVRTHIVAHMNGTYHRATTFSHPTSPPTSSPPRHLSTASEPSTPANHASHTHLPA